MTVILNCRADLTLEAARRVAWDGEDVVLGAASQQAITQARARFMALIDDPEITIYGVTSGYGQNARVRLTPEQRKVHADRPLSGSDVASLQFVISEYPSVLNPVIDSRTSPACSMGTSAVTRDDGVILPDSTTRSMSGWHRAGIW